MFLALLNVRKSHIPSILSLPVSPFLSLSIKHLEPRIRLHMLFILLFITYYFINYSFFTTKQKKIQIKMTSFFFHFICMIHLYKIMFHYISHMIVTDIDHIQSPIFTSCSLYTLPSFSNSLFFFSF